MLETLLCLHLHAKRGPRPSCTLPLRSFPHRASPRDSSGPVRLEGKPSERTACAGKARTTEALAAQRPKAQPCGENRAYRAGDRGLDPQNQSCRLPHGLEGTAQRMLDSSRNALTRRRSPRT